MPACEGARGVTCGKLLLVEPRFVHLQNEGKRCPHGVIIRVKMLTSVRTCLAHVSHHRHHHGHYGRHHRPHCHCHHRCHRHQQHHHHRHGHGHLHHHFSVSVSPATPEVQGCVQTGLTLVLSRETYTPEGKTDIHQILCGTAVVIMAVWKLLACRNLTRSEGSWQDSLRNGHSAQPSRARGAY